MGSCNLAVNSEKRLEEPCFVQAISSRCYHRIMYVKVVCCTWIYLFNFTIKFNLIKFFTVLERIKRENVILPHLPFSVHFFRFSSFILATQNDVNFDRANNWNETKHNLALKGVPNSPFSPPHSVNLTLSLSHSHKPTAFGWACFKCVPERQEATPD